MPLHASVGPHVLTRWYIDTRPLTLDGGDGTGNGETLLNCDDAPSDELPLVHTLRPQEQKTVKAYRHLRDRHMSLASNLLKYLFIHRACKVPWRDVAVSRSALPHGRPCYVPSRKRNGDDGNGDEAAVAVEFNVSHQGCITALAGCFIPKNANVAGNGPDDVRGHDTPLSMRMPQIGIDITCTDDPTTRRKRANDDDNGRHQSYPVGPNNPPKTEEQLQSFLDMMEEAFSVHEVEDMRTRGSMVGHTHPPAYDASVPYRVRLFFTYWALKEAFIKMTGEALFAPWLRDLEFRNVDAPPFPSESRGHRQSPSPPFSGYDDNKQQDNWGEPLSSSTIHAFLYGRHIKDVILEVVAFEDDYIFTTAARGCGFSPRRGVRNNEDLPSSSSPDSLVRWDSFRRVDIERDVRPCATGQCRCLG